ncbi:MAG TPA: glycosyltransferase [Rhodocyclaceae bacterium]|nr:glycosyltransferase [Rhodocyclaceae bacterium]
MRFVFVVTNLAGGGAEKAVVKLTAGLAAKGHDVEIVLLENRLEHQPPQGVKISTLTANASTGWLGKRFLARRLARHLSTRHDLLVSTLPFADEVTTLANLPRHWCRIANTLGAEIDKLAARNPAKARRRLARYRRLYGARPLVAVSAGVATDLRNRIGIEGRIETIPNPFDFEAIRRAAAADFAADWPARPYVLHVGRFSPQKRHDLLLDAWTRLDTDRQLVLLTAADPRLQAMIEARGLAGRVRIAGFQTNPYPWITGADLLVLCSDHEGLPNVLIEALACGTPAISTDCPSGPREILAAFPECLVPCGDVAALAKAISGGLAIPIDTAKADLSAFATGSVIAAYEQLAAER